MFHVREGWTFERMETGEIRVAKYLTPFVDPSSTPLQTELVMSEDEWESAVKAVSTTPTKKSAPIAAKEKQPRVL